MIPSVLDFSRTPTEHLRLILQLPNVAEPYRRRVQDELRARPEQRTSKRSSGKRQIVTVTAPVPGQSLLLTIRPEPPSANEIKRWLYGGRVSHEAHGARHRYANYRDALRRDFIAYSDLALRGGPLHIEHRWRVSRQRDEDGFGLSLKPVLDAMESAGLIENDRDVRLVFGGQVAGGEGCSTERGVTLVCSRC
jgi:hypothetical protein